MLLLMMRKEVGQLLSGYDYDDSLAPESNQIRIATKRLAQPQIIDWLLTTPCLTGLTITCIRR